ncbi:hypothetical protein CEQ90_15560 [Lewinellaceae bacterium SD302]|nr:hypothetical protein CEQ90_15560 [Lewinellaceae bacterium SD302]
MLGGKIYLTSMNLIADLWPLALLVLLTTLLTEWATKAGKFPYWIGRKILHFVAVGSCALAVRMTDDLNSLFWLILPVWLLLFYLIATNKLMRDERGRPAWGIVWFPFAYLILLWFYAQEPRWIYLSMLILAISDPLATIFGKLFGKLKYSLSGEPKSLTGNAAFSISCLVILSYSVPYHFEYGFIHDFGLFLYLIVILLTVAEALGSYGSDNLHIPLFAIWLLSDPQDLTMLSPVIVVLMLAIPFIWLTVRSQKLTLGAAITATLLAIIVTFKSGSYLPLLPLIFFFGSSLLLEKIFPTKVLSDSKDRRSRDIMQVMANGGVYGAIFLFLPELTREFIGVSQTGKVAVSLYEAQRESVVLGRFLLGMGLVSLAVATADTWASTIGKRFAKTAFDPFRWQKVPAGLSGGISLPGTLAALLGSVGIASFLYLLLPDWRLIIPHLIMISIAGFGGMLVDSFLGSRLQRQYFYAGRWHDTPPDSGTPGQTRGLSWMTNDVVNLVSIMLVCGTLGLIFLLR